MKASER